MRPVLALDIGGTKIAAGIVDAKGQLLHQNRQPTPHSADPDEVWSAAERTIADALAAAGGDVSGVGISSAGPIHLSDGTISPVNIAAWRGFGVVERAAAAVPGVPVRLAGDGLCMALGEHWRGAGRGAAFMLGMVVSTGVGGGLVLDGRPYAGRTGNAVEDEWRSAPPSKAVSEIVRRWMSEAASASSRNRLSGALDRISL